MAARTSAYDIGEVNVRYHEVAAPGYDAKWGIDFGDMGRRQVLGKVRKALGNDAVGHLGHCLEVGSGTGYFSLNLLQAGVIDRATCTDVSPGMLRVLEANARDLGLTARIETRACDAGELPFGDESFDLVLGHAVLHHLPDLPAAFAEFRRVLRPDGRLIFAGEPSRLGDRLARIPKHAALRVAPLWRRAVRARPADPGDRDGPADATAAAAASAAAAAAAAADDHALEPFVDVHTFAPQQLEAAARAQGFTDVRVSGEELLANWFGWANRTLEATSDPDSIPWLWRQYAYRGYLALQALDAALLEPRLPAGVFYNLLLSARRA